MSLDVYLRVKNPIKKSGTGVYVRDNGKTRELTIEEIREKFPDAEVDLQVYETECAYSDNITHNLGEMAQAADIYTALWRPDDQGWTYAKDTTGMLERGLKRLTKDPDGFKKYNPENGWGSYEDLVSFVYRYLVACREYPDAEIEVWR